MQYNYKAMLVVVEKKMCILKAIKLLVFVAKHGTYLKYVYYHCITREIINEK
jgi:hypothetical protein